MHQPIGTVCDCGEPGWMPGVEHAPILWNAPAYYFDTPMQPARVVDHIMQGFLSTMVDWSTTQGGGRVIVHFGIGRAGRIVQMHPVDRPGIHAGWWNLDSIAIEHEGASVDPRPAYSVPAALIYSPANPWPDAMVEASVRVKRWCFATASSLGAPSRQSIVGHYENGDPNRVNDPAAAAARDVWPVARMIAALTEEDEVRVRVLDVPAAIQEVQRFVRNATDAIDPSDGDGMYEIEAGFPGAKPGKKYVVLEMDRDA